MIFMNYAIFGNHHYWNNDSESGKKWKEKDEFVFFSF